VVSAGVHSPSSSFASTASVTYSSARSPRRPTPAQPPAARVGQA
jgi:hypothetical protein